VICFPKQAATSISVQERLVILSCQQFGTPYHPVFGLQVIQLLLDVTSMNHCFQSVLPPPSDPAANASWFLPEVGAIHLLTYLLTYLNKYKRRNIILSSLQQQQFRQAHSKHVKQQHLSLKRMMRMTTAAMIRTTTMTISAICHGCSSIPSP